MKLLRLLRLLAFVALFVALHADDTPTDTPTTSGAGSTAEVTTVSGSTSGFTTVSTGPNPTTNPGGDQTTNQPTTTNKPAPTGTTTPPVPVDYKAKVTLLRLENLGGTVADGTPCSDFGFVGRQCSLNLKVCIQAGASTTVAPCTEFQDLGQVSVDSNAVDLKETKYNNINNVFEVSISNGVFEGFTLTAVITTSDGRPVDEWTYQFADGSILTGVSTYTSIRSQGLGTSLKVAWTSNANIPTTTAVPTTGPTTTYASTTYHTNVPTTKVLIANSCDDFPDRVDGVRTIYPDGVTAVDTYCQYGTNGGGALNLMQSRDHGDPTNDKFDSPLEFYKQQFGEPAFKAKNYWMGLENIYNLVKNGDFTLRIDLCCHATAVQTQYYSNFTLGDSTSGYVLNAVPGQAGIGLDIYNPVTQARDIGSKFATYDTLMTHDPDFVDGCDVLRYYGNQSTPLFNNGTGGWWFGTCGNNLNNHFVSTPDVGDETICLIKDPPTPNGAGVELRTTSGAIKFDSSGDTRYYDGHSYNRVRMSVYKTNNVPLGINPSDFCAE